MEHVARVRGVRSRPPRVRTSSRPRGDHTHATWNLGGPLLVLLALGAAAITTASLIGVKTLSVLLSLDPAIAALAGVLWLGQRLGAAEVLGVGLVVLASSGVMATRTAS
jgi:threonine/homoserine efflux transporter RhtA